MTTVQTDRGSELSNELLSKGNKMHLESLDDPDTDRNIDADIDIDENKNMLKESVQVPMLKSFLTEQS